MYIRHYSTYTNFILSRKQKLCFIKMSKEECFVQNYCELLEKSSDISGSSSSYSSPEAFCTQLLLYSPLSYCQLISFYTLTPLLVYYSLHLHRTLGCRWKNLYSREFAVVVNSYTWISCLYKKLRAIKNITSKSQCIQ